MYQINLLYLQCNLNLIYMKYNEGDKVQIKSLDWYNENKNILGNVECGDALMTFEKTRFCGNIVTISSISDVTDTYGIEEDNGLWIWTDEMIEGLVERNGKTYPYKIGDRVILKGNNRCATITDLKYNSWGNLSYYIKIDNDKDISIDYPTELLLPYDNMVKEVVEKEFNPKFKVGDKIISDVFSTKDDKGWKVVDVERTGYKLISVNNSDLTCDMDFKNEHYYKLVEEESSIDLAVKGEDTKERIEIAIPEGYEYVIESDKIVFIKKKKEYPKTIEECCKILGLEFNPFYTGVKRQVNYKDGLLHNLKCLLIYRDAYWKIAGEEMGLGKPWDMKCGCGEWGYWIGYDVNENKIYCQDSRTLLNRLLVFPTEEMRDVFYENFKSEIEICKEFL